MSKATNLLKESQLVESYTQLIHFSAMLPQLRKTNRSTDRPLWTDRSGDYQKDLGIMTEIIQELLDDYSARIGKEQLMKALFEVELE